jgi:hypothetical protein
MGGPTGDPSCISQNLNSINYNPTATIMSQCKVSATESSPSIGIGVLQNIPNYEYTVVGIAV